MFFGKFRPDCKAVKNALTRMGFEPRKNSSGTSHEQWVRCIKDRMFKVTVDCPKAPFGDDLVKSMATQAGVTKRQFIEYCKDKKKIGHPLESTASGPA